MEQKKNYRNDLKGAAASTLSMVLLVTVMARNNAKDDISGVISIVVLLGLFVSTIYLWIRGTKRYIDFAIEEKIKQKQIKE